MSFKKSMYLFFFVSISIIAYIFIYPNNKNNIVRDNITYEKAPNFSLPNQYGDTISLYDFKGNFLLIDFWASWCVACRKDNPNIVELYEKYSSKGLAFLSISLDGLLDQEKPKEDWVQAINEDRLIWENVSELKGWRSKVRNLYEIERLPMTILIDKEGNIITKDKNTIEEKIKSILR